MYYKLYRRKKLTPEQESEICKKCQFCCRWFITRIQANANNDDYYQFVHGWGHPLLYDNLGILYLMIPYPCQHIREGTGCSIYEDRPAICKRHKGGDSDHVIRPFCGWYEPIPEPERFQAMKSIEWNNPPDKQDDEK